LKCDPWRIVAQGGLLPPQATMPAPSFPSTCHSDHDGGCLLQWVSSKQNPPLKGAYKLLYSFCKFTSLSNKTIHSNHITETQPRREGKSDLTERESPENSFTFATCRPFLSFHLFF